jgi:hypothetical protein
MKETCSVCGHSFRNHGIDGCYFVYYDERGIMQKRCSCERNEFEEYDILEEKLELAIDFLDKLSHWDMLWIGEGMPNLVADGPYWKKEIDETLRKLKE